MYSRIKSLFKIQKPVQRLRFSELAGNDKEEKLLTFIPLLHLENQSKLWLDQERHFEEIWISLREIFDIHKANIEKELERELEISELAEKIRERLAKKETSNEMPEIDNEQRRRLVQIENEFENPLADFFKRI